jgi:glycosyltransferase involved in cell wall biosynthesis
VSSGDFLKVAYYGLLAKILHFPLLLNSVEFYSATTRSKRPTARLKAWLRDRSAYAFVDGVLPISEFLLSKAVDMAPHKPVLKVSVVADIDRFSHLKRNPDHLYFLFCGSLIYLEVVEFILDVFERMEANGDVRLYLVLNGSSEEFERFNGRLRRSTRYTSIRVFSKITDQEVAALYVDAFALLIPLRPTLQDEARFPHKIAEYCASGRPIITTNVGEVPVYFRNNENAVVVEHYDVNEYAQAMKELLNHPEDADRIGQKGFEVAQSEFNHLVSAGKVRTFLDSFGL